MKRYIIGSLLCLALGAGFTSCSSEDELDSVSVLQVDPEIDDPTSPTYKFDRWVKVNYLERYNMTFTYRMKSLATDPNYNLVPADYEKAKQLAVLTKYLWYDVYDEITGGPNFLRQYGPKMLHLIGSSAVNPGTGTEILGLAEGGLKVSLFVVNQLNPEDPELLNAKYFKTMHHEFAHILHQTKTYPKNFNELNAANYEPNTWQERLGGTTCSMGFTSPYASGEAREDFAETCANYICRTQDEWDLTLWLAGQGWKEIDDSYITYRLAGTWSLWPANNDAVMSKYGFCYWYYRNDDDKKKNLKTYTCQFVEREEVYYVTDLELTCDKDDSATDSNAQYLDYLFYYMNGGKKKMKKVADIEKWLKETYTDKGIEIFPVDDTDKLDGRKIILEKTNIARQWYASAWGIKLDDLRALVHQRQANIHIDELLAPIEEMK